MELIGILPTRCNSIPDRLFSICHINISRYTVEVKKMQLDVGNEPHLSRQKVPCLCICAILSITSKSSPDRQTDDRQKVMYMSPPCNLHRWAQKLPCACLSYLCLIVCVSPVNQYLFYGSAPRAFGERVLSSSKIFTRTPTLWEFPIWKVKQSNALISLLVYPRISIFQYNRAQSNMPIKGNVQKTSFQHLDIDHLNGVHPEISRCQAKRAFQVTLFYASFLWSLV